MINLDDFNPSQREAVEYCDGPSLVIAGAGSGKTRVLTYKIAYLIDHGYEPWSILALTFTNKAANEMKERIAKIVGTEQARRLWMGTFHSVFLRILRHEHDSIGFSSNFTIYDAADSKSLVKSIIKEMELDDKTYKSSTVLETISNAKNQLVTAEEYIQNPSNLQVDARRNMPAISEIFKRYVNRCRQSDAMDFDDILLFTHLLFDKCPDIRTKWAERFQYVLVDEYQDTNYAQHRIVWQLTSVRQKVCVVGDDAQSIYSFRGANIDNILNFQDSYSGSKLFKLEQNYRSTQNIVEAANSLIGKNKKQIEKHIFSDNDKGDLIELRETFSDLEEAKYVVNAIRAEKRKDNSDYSDFAILYRTNAQSRVFEEALRKENVPYRIFGGLSFYQRKEIKDIIAYFRLAVNPNDEEAFRRVINYPARGIGNTTVNKIVTQAVANNTSLWNVISMPQQYGLSVTGGTANKIQYFHDLIEYFITKAQEADADEAGVEIIKKSGIINDVYQDSTPENLSRQENVEEFVNGLRDFVQLRKEEGNENISITDYLSEVSLLSDVDTDKGDDDHKVTLMTIHSAKGLEFSTVFVVGMEEGLFPSQMAGNSPREIEEERRLFYVAMTRAKLRCHLTYAKSRFRYGKMEFGTPSRFLGDIDGHYLKRTTSGSSSGGTLFSTSSSRYNDIDLPWSRKRSTTTSSSPVYGRSSSAPTFGSSRPSPGNYGTRPATNGGIGTRPSTMQPRTAPSTPAPSKVQSANGLHVGATIQHERFGRGEVVELTGGGDSLKATVRFEQVGQKQLLLKFARYTIIK